jgi:hypothetical protein
LASLALSMIAPGLIVSKGRDAAGSHLLNTNRGIARDDTIPCFPLQAINHCGHVRIRNSRMFVVAESRGQDHANPDALWLVEISFPMMMDNRTSSKLHSRTKW